VKTDPGKSTGMTSDDFSFLIRRVIDLLQMIGRCGAEFDSQISASTQRQLVGVKSQIQSKFLAACRIDRASSMLNT